MALGSGKVVLVIGASRGIGRQIAIDLAKNGYSVIVAAKSTSDATSSTAPFPPDPNSPQSTISTVEREIVEAGGRATAIAVDVRDRDSVQKLVDKTIEVYGRLDALVYNSGAIWWASVADTPVKRFQLMQKVNIEGLYSAVYAALPHLQRNKSGGRIVVVSPPIYSRFFRGKTAYAMGKIGMSVLTKGLAMDFQRQRRSDMAITSLWPAVAVQSAATIAQTTQNPSISHDLRHPTIFSDAVLAVLRAPASAVNGELLLDEDFLRSEAGGSLVDADFDAYAVVPGTKPRRIMPAVLPDLTVAEQDDEGTMVDSSVMEKERQTGKAKL